MNDETMGSKHHATLRLRRPRAALVIASIFTVLVAIGLLTSLIRPGCPSTVAASPALHTDHRHHQSAPPDAWRAATHLILVAGHAVYTASSRTASSVQSEASWHLEPFQRGQLATMLGHIRRGVAIASMDNSSLLIFSGGETRAAAGP